VAAAYTPLPPWLAVMEQEPAEISDKAVPLTVHTDVVFEAKVTVKPDVADADKAAGAVPSTWLPGDEKLIVCAMGWGATTLKVWVTEVAGR